jgi:hypothetical protein
MENLHVDNEYHDICIVGFHHDKYKKTLILITDSTQEIIFNRIVQFELNFFSDENIIFEIKKFEKEKIPQTIIEDYPFLRNFIEREDEYFFFVIDPSVGLSGIVVCEEDN